MKKQILRYWLAMNASAFDSAIHALVLFCGIAGTHQVLPESVPALNLQQLVALFFIAFGRAVLAYLDAHPVSQLATGPEADQVAAAGAAAGARESSALPEHGASPGTACNPTPPTFNT